MIDDVRSKMVCVGTIDFAPHRVSPIASAHCRQLRYDSPFVIRSGRHSVFDSGWLWWIEFDWHFWFCYSDSSNSPQSYIRETLSVRHHFGLVLITVTAHCMFAMVTIESATERSPDCAGKRPLNSSTDGAIIEIHSSSISMRAISCSQFCSDKRG